MALFPYSYSPRLVDDCDIFQLADDWVRPFYAPRELRSLRNVRDLAQQLACLKDSEVQDTDKEFNVKLNMVHYTPDEVKISTDNNKVVITAKHEEKEDKHGFVSREMTRIYTFPPGVDPKSLTSTMTRDGCLRLSARKHPQETPKEVTIPVEFKG